MDARTVDQEVALNEFLKEIRDHTISDLKGLATERVRKRLRTVEVYIAWRTEIHKIVQMGGPLATLAQQRSGELNELKKKYNSMKMELGGISQLLRETFGEDPPNGEGFEALLAHLICRLYRKLEGIEKKIGGIDSPPAYFEPGHLPICSKQTGPVKDCAICWRYVQVSERAVAVSFAPYQSNTSFHKGCRYIGFIGEKCGKCGQVVNSKNRQKDPEP